MDMSIWTLGFMKKYMCLHYSYIVIKNTEIYYYIKNIYVYIIIVIIITPSTLNERMNIEHVFVLKCDLIFNVSQNIF